MAIAKTAQIRVWANLILKSLYLALLHRMERYEWSCQETSSAAQSAWGASSVQVSLA